MTRNELRNRLDCIVNLVSEMSRDTHLFPHWSLCCAFLVLVLCCICFVGCLPRDRNTYLVLVVCYRTGTNYQPAWMMEPDSAGYPVTSYKRERHTHKMSIKFNVVSKQQLQTLTSIVSVCISCFVNYDLDSPGIACCWLLKRLLIFNGIFSNLFRDLLQHIFGALNNLKQLL